MRVAAVLGLAAALALLAGGAATTATRGEDYAAVALNLLAPGQSGNLNLDRNSTDQLRLYDALTPRGANVTARDLRRYFKPAWFGLRGTRAVRTVRPRRGVTIVRDAWGVPHIEGRTEQDVAFGAGWATAEDRGLVLQLIRGPGRLAALDAPNLDPLALLGHQFVPSRATEQFLDGQTAVLRRAGAKGRAALRDFEAYAKGINAYFRSKRITGDPWTRRDTYAAAALIASQFGRGGGDELRRSMFLSALRTRLGAERGRQVFDDLRQLQSSESTVSAQSYRATTAPAGGVVLDDGSFEPPTPSIGTVERLSMSNAVLVSARRSRTGHPLFVSGPQVGFSYPAFFTELDIHGGGLDARGISFPGTFGVVIGRGKDFVWSAQSSHSDVIDHYVETLCGDDTHYRFGGTCREMGTFDAGTLDGRPVRFRTTVHGPVLGYARLGGVRVAISSKRSSRGREILSSLAFRDLNRNLVRSARDFARVMNQVEFSFNWVYADHRDIAFFSAGRLPVRPAGAGSGLPTAGTGEYEWRRFATLAEHAQGINPKWGYIVGWNNRPAPGYPAADDTWNWGSVQRVDLLKAQVAARRKHTLASVVGALNVAATQDLRAVRVWPAIAAVLSTGPAPSPRTSELVNLLNAWTGSRLDRDLDGWIDAPGAAILDAAWPKLADAVLRPVLGPLVDRLAALEPRDDHPAGSQGSAYGAGWYGYVEHDLRDLLGRKRQPFRVRYCGNGDLAACRASLWDALESAGSELSAAQGPDPARWRADARPERIRFSGGILQSTMRFANRPTFQQVMSFRSHRPRARRRR
ncbi:MAG TPA: penicillin acylase family protein [Gaiellaceae bacterium]|nr:penicillin acylase family protein [Gaiellaceae bacterium]